MAIGFDAYASGALTLAIWLMVVVIVGGLGTVAFFLVRKWYRFSDYKCVIFFRDGFGQLSYRTDSAGIFIDTKTKNKRFFLKKANVGLDPNNVPVLPGKNKTVFLVQYGLKNFSFIKVNIDMEGLTFSVGEEDVNWAVNACEREEKKWQVKDKLLQYMPYISLAIVMIIILVMFIYLFKAIPGMLVEIKAIVIEAQKLQAMNAGTTVIPA